MLSVHTFDFLHLNVPHGQMTMQHSEPFDRFLSFEGILDLLPVVDVLDDGLAHEVSVARRVHLDCLEDAAVETLQSHAFYFFH